MRTLLPARPRRRRRPDRRGEPCPRPSASRPATSRVDNNIIRHGGRIFPCAVGVWIGHSGDNQVTHNDIADFYYTGISVGWRWGYADSLAKRNIIDFNHIHHLGWGVLSDMGGIYTLGPSEGTVVSNNVIHDVYSYAYGGWGLYNDEGSTGIVMENNLVYNTKTGGFHQHYGKENVIRNNIFVFSMHHQLQAHPRRGAPLVHLREQHRLLGDRPAAGGSLDQDHDQHGQQLLLEHGRPAGRRSPADRSTSGGSSRSTTSTRSSPIRCSSMPRTCDFRLKPDSPALKLGFKPFDYTQAGVYGDPAWVAKANEVTYPPLEWPPEPPPLAINDDFEKTAVGQPPQGAEVHVENKGDSIAVTDETAASGKHSLKITDAPGPAKRVEPAPGLLSQPRHRHDPLRVRPADRARCLDQPRVAGLANTRTASARASPIVGDALQVGRQDAPAPASGQMGPLRNHRRPGPEEHRHLDLTVTLPGEPPKVFKALKNGSSTFEKLTWLGFTSNATDKSSLLPGQPGDHESAVRPVCSVRRITGKMPVIRHGQRAMLRRCHYERPCH